MRGENIDSDNSSVSRQTQLQQRSDEISLHAFSYLCLGTENEKARNDKYRFALLNIRKYRHAVYPQVVEPAWKQVGTAPEPLRHCSLDKSITREGIHKRRPGKRAKFPKR